MRSLLECTLSGLEGVVLCTGSELSAGFDVIDGNVIEFWQGASVIWQKMNLETRVSVT